MSATLDLAKAITTSQAPRLGMWVWVFGSPTNPAGKALGRVTNYTAFNGCKWGLIQVRTLRERSHKLPVEHASWFDLGQIVAA